MKSLSRCPVCQGTDFIPYLKCQDYTVSHETFQLVSCKRCEFTLTNPQPETFEISRYYESDAYISHSDKSRSIIAMLYKLSRAYTLKWKYKLITKHAHPGAKSILDYGCGTGKFLNECLKHGLKASGVEPSNNARNLAKSNTNATVEETIERIDGSFDIITLWHVLEHVADLRETISFLKHRLNKNGTIFIAVPNLRSLDAKIYGQYWAAYDVPRHLWHFTKDTMRRLLTDNNLKLTAILPMKLDAFYVSLLSEKYARQHAAISAFASSIDWGS